MATPLTRNTIIGVAPEVTEGTYVAPTANQAIQVVEFPTITPEAEVIERNIIKGSIGRLKPLQGLHSGSIEFQVEAKAAGVTGGLSDQPEIHDLLRSALGTFHNAGANSLTDVASTDTIIELDTGDGSNFVVGAILMILGEVRFVRSILGDQLTLNRALSKGAPASGVTVFGGWTYFPVTSGHLPLSITAFLGDWEQRMLGCRASNLAFADFSTGQIPKLSFTFDVIDHDSVVGTLLANPVYEDQVPPLALAGNIFKDTTLFCINNLALTNAQTVTPETCINTPGGRNRLFVTDRNITGTFDPFVDDTTVQRFTDWINNNDFEIEAVLSIPDVSGDFVQGTSFGIWLPQTNYTGMSFTDNDGTVAHELPFSAHESASLNDEIYMGFI